MAELTRKEVIQIVAMPRLKEAVVSLAGVDLSGLDLSKLNLEGAGFSAGELERLCLEGGVVERGAF